MELATGKVFPQGGESTEETLSRLCTSFAQFIDEVGFYVGKLSEQQKKTDETIKELSEKLSALTEQEVVS